MDSPLVTIVVVTYNSSKYVLETLEGVNHQTYDRIELVVTDDCSTDDTNEIVSKWIKDHSSRFERVSHIISPVNTGVGANCNRGLYEAKGEWVIFPAGDDVLLSDAIYKYICFVENHPQVNMCHAKMRVYMNTMDEVNLISSKESKYDILRDNNKSPKEKLQYLFFFNGINGPATFFYRNFLVKIGGFDETFQRCEDLPSWMMILSNNENIYYLDEETVKYRVHDSSINFKAARSSVFPKYFEVDNYLYQKYLKDTKDILVKYTIRYNYYLRKAFCKIGFDRPSFFTVFLFRIMNVPFVIVKKIINRP